MAKRIEATKYIKRDDLLAYPLRRETLDNELLGTYFVNGVEAAIEYAEKLPFVECKAYVRSGEDPKILKLKDITEYIDLADLMKCPLLEIDLDRTLNKNWYFLSGVESVMEYARRLQAVRVKMNNEVNDIIPVYARRMVTAPPVRCKDCRHSYEDIGGLTCSHGICVDCIVRENFFCADGVKREVADD